MPSDRPDRPDHPSAPAAASRTLVFQGAFVGALLPRLIAMFDDKGVHLPGVDWAHFFGWLALALVLALFAGWVAANIWRERDAQRAFFLGLGFLYVINGGATDVQKLVTPPPARAQSVAPPAVDTRGMGTIRVTMDVKAAADPARRVVLVIKSAAAGDPARREVARVENPPLPFSTLVPPGDYVVEASAPNVSGSKRVTVRAGQVTAVDLELHGKSAVRSFFQGVQGAILDR